LVEFVGIDCFEHCHSLLSLSFESPSHLRRLLDLPPELSGVVRIPDSVEIVAVGPYSDFHGGLVLSFGSESKFIAIWCRDVWLRPVKSRLPSSSFFVQLSTRSLKGLRGMLEFADKLQDVQ
jgi:hypothetical protein